MNSKFEPKVLLAVRLFLQACRFKLLLTVILLSVVTGGCSSQSQHKVLTFFFTGVPPLEEKSSEAKSVPNDAAVSKKSQTQKNSKNLKIAPAGTEKPLPIVPEAPRLFSHTVWAEGGCVSCHEGSSTFGFAAVGKPVKSAAPKEFFAGGGMPGKLRQPKEKICLPCHKDKSGLRAIKDQLWLHNPVAKGDCLACHDAHQGKYQGVLRKAPDQLCSVCHPQDKLAATEMHRDEKAPCLSCHNPHMGRDRNLLSKDYQEVKQAANYEM